MSFTRFKISMLLMPRIDLVAVRKMVTDIFFADRSEQRIRNRMRENVRVRMSVESMRVRNLDATENEFTTLRQVDARRNRCRNESCASQLAKSIRRSDATMLYLSFISVRGVISTTPPAVSTRIQPAAMSQKLIPCSM